MLLVGAIPTGLAPLVKNATGLYLIRFFMGILGGSFVPCQVWTTAFFDKNVVGSANALAGGFGNAGGGITYFIMPAVFDSLVNSGGYSDSVAWRLTFLVPLCAVVATGVALLWFCLDTPDGAWGDRHVHAQQHLAAHQVAYPCALNAADAEAQTTAEHTVLTSTEDKLGHAGRGGSGSGSGNGSGNSGDSSPVEPRAYVKEVHLTEAEMLATAIGEVVQNPNMSESLKVTFSLQTLALALTYMCSFGGELAINSVLSTYYLSNFPQLGQTDATRWAAMFGFLNFVTRPSGGAIADALYRKGPGVGQSRFKHHHRLWFKRHWITMCGILGGGALVLVGKALDPQRTGHPPSEAATFVLIALSAVFLEAGNGANFALVPHVHPQANGIVSGLTGAAGNLGGVIFAIIFRFVTHKPVAEAPPAPNYSKSFWIIGVIHIVANAAVSWVEPIPKDQVVGH